jgi:hypothetical protein
MPSPSSLPLPPKQSPFGWPLVDRREEFHRQEQSPVSETFRVADFQGQSSIKRPIFRVPINLPKYRIANGRTASAQQEYAAIKSLPVGFFDGGDPELEQIQIAQHEILKTMIKAEGLQKKFRDAGNKQVEPLLLDENGYVVNGNRRLCCWRELFLEDSSKFGHFGHVDVVVLPHCEEQVLDELEAKLQVEEDIRSDYKWHAEANMIAQKQRLHGLTTQHITQLYKMSKRDVEKLLAMRDLAVEFLAVRGKPNQWSLLDGAEYAFRELHKAMGGLNTAGERELMKQVVFTLIGNAGAAEERLYDVIPDIKEHFTAVKQQLAEAFPLPPVVADTTAVDLFGLPIPTAATASTNATDLQLVQEMRRDPASEERARGVVLETVRSQEEQSRDRDTAQFLFNTLKKANNQVQNALGHGLRSEAVTGGVAAQIQAIKQGLDRIEAWLNARSG